MNDDNKTAVKMVIAVVASIWVVVGFGVIVMGGSSSQHEDAAIPLPTKPTMESNLKTASPAWAIPPSAPANPAVKQRLLKDVYARRAFPGAPPSIPHPPQGDGHYASNCNACHEKGGYVPVLNAYTPPTPHPEFEHCQQCHTYPTRTDEQLFRQIDWQAAQPPALHRPALAGNPPPIPHTLQLRDNCLACHGGPSAPLEIRTSHPEREQCRQCHVPRSLHEGPPAFFPTDLPKE